MHLGGVYTPSPTIGQAYSPASLEKVDFTALVLSTYYPVCYRFATLFQVPHINIHIDNGGDGGHANSGPAAGSLGSGSVSFSGTPHHETSNSNAIGNSFSGTGGDASGGSVYGASGIINVLSSKSLSSRLMDQDIRPNIYLLDNGGHGGEANSGSSGLRNPPTVSSKPRRLSSRIMQPRFL